MHIATQRCLAGAVKDAQWQQTELHFWQGTFYFHFPLVPQPGSTVE